MPNVVVKVLTKVPGTKVGIDNVEVELLTDTGAPFSPAKTGTTAGGGTYTFPGVVAGDYLVRITEKSVIELLSGPQSASTGPSYQNAAGQTIPIKGVVPRADYDEAEVTATVGDTVRFKVVGPRFAMPSSPKRRVKLLAEVMQAAAVATIEYVGNDPANLPTARKIMEELFCGSGSILEVLGPPPPPPPPAPLDLADDTCSEVESTNVNVKTVPCATCYQYYNTPGTAYYRNYSLLQSCLYTPPCG